jgi:spermidine/putrescine transport system permease protein
VKRRGATIDVAVSRNGKRLLLAFFVLFLVFLYLPTVMLTIFSFNDSPNVAFPLSGFTTQFYEDAFANEQVRSSFFASLRVAAGTAVVATIIGVLVSYALARRRFRGKPVVSALVLLPLVVPTVVLGIALLILFRPQNPPIDFLAVPLGLWAVLIGHVVFALPFCILLLLPRIASIDRRIEEAAFDLGASWFTTFRRIVLPLITPALISSLLIAFVISIDEVVIASFLVQDQVTYPVYLYSGLRISGQTTILMPIATVMIVASFLLVIAAEVIRRVGERRLGIAE